ncbi:MAG: ribonuclease R [Desulfobulbus sp.]|nr:ribonuclease R [Desulfobulbus sp.]
MTRKFFHNRRRPRPVHKKRKPSGRHGKDSDHLQTAIQTLLTEADGPLTAAEIVNALYLTPVQSSLLRKVLGQMLTAGTVLKKGKLFTAARVPEQLKGTLDLTGKGFGFVTPEGEEVKGGKDIYIAPHNLNAAGPGDTVVIAVTGTTSRGRREGRVLKVLHRAVTKVCGVYNLTPAGGQVLPDDGRLPYSLFIPGGEDLGARDGMAVIAEIIHYGSSQQSPTGRIIEILGDPRQADVQIRMAIFQFSLREHFPATAEDEASRLLPVTQASGDRIDLRHLLHVTIDGEDARDFDDAICVERSEGGFVLYVSIADVGYYVRPGSAIDQEAYLRGTSVYLPDRVLPMLPERLSNDLCSLMPDTDRPAFTAVLEFDFSGQRVAEHYRKSLIRSKKRLTYTTVHQILSVRNPEIRAAHAELVPMLEQADHLAALLNSHRIQRGSLEFNLPEPVIRLENSRVVEISQAARYEAHQLIEAFMLAANEAVAESLSQAKLPVLYRIHEPPDPAKLETFTDAAHALGIHTPHSATGPAWFAQIIAHAKKSPNEYLVNSLLLRTLQQARYSPENSGHFGLAAAYYLHFTSPIRRYPDLIAHRVLQSLLTGTAEQHLTPQPKTDLAEAGAYLSQCERKAIDVERNIHARCSALYLLEQVGERFTGIISGVSASGLYITLDDTFISGMIPLSSMSDDYYLFDSRRYRLIGENSNRIYQLGSRIHVRLDRVDLLDKQLSFSLITDG